ncbi:MAG: hypothetical protein HY064_05185 [Bacteroidetes bacterium]|nr:hypothetical protein [Bacteroidota bacterium]
MENNNFFDAWLETQKQLMNNWTESNKKLQDSVKTGSSMKEGATIYQEWLNKQMEITKNANENASKTFKTEFEKNTEAFKNGKSFDSSEAYSNWMKAQKEIAEKSFDTFRTFSQPYTSNNQFATETLNKTAEFNQQWWNANQDWTKKSSEMWQQWVTPFQNWSGGLNDSNMKETWNNMMNYSGSFVKFYELWSPLYKNMMSNTYSNEWMKNSFNASAFKDLMDKTISWISPVQTKDLFQQWQNWTEVTSNYSKHVFGQFAGSTPETFKNLFPYLAFGNNPENPYNNIFSIYQRALTPLVKLFNPGKETELNEDLVSLAEKMTVYGQKLTELQQFMYATGAKSWETYTLESFEEVKKGTDLSDSQEAFRKWTNKNEEVFLTLFKSDEYSKLQGELLDLGLEIKQHGEKIAEILLQPLPVVLRSEANELYTTIYELRKRVHALEKQAGSEETESKEVKSSKKKTATV